MNVLLNRNQTGFTMVANKLLCATNLSLRGKALYAYLCSKPHHWSFSITRMVTEMEEGKDAINSVLNELEKINLLRRRKMKTPTGKWDGVIYYLNNVDDSNLVTEFFQHKKNEQTTGRSMTERKDEFRVRCLAVYETKKQKMNKEMGKKFFDYWTEETYGGKKMRFELQTTFNINLRMDTWIANQEKYRREAIAPKQKPELQTKNT